MVNYFEMINKHIDPNSAFYAIYVPHVTMVTQKALTIAQRLGLDTETQRFIEEAAMLHDIGISVNIDAPKLHVSGDMPYICHGSQGRELLEKEGLPKHALVAERHTGVGITLEEIEARDLPIPHREMSPQSLPEKIISYADLFFSKSPHKLWRQESADQIEAEIAEYGQKYVAIFKEWQQQFE